MIEGIVFYVGVTVVRGLAKLEYISSGYFKGAVNACLVGDWNKKKKKVFGYQSKVRARLSYVNDSTAGNNTDGFHAYVTYAMQEVFPTHPATNKQKLTSLPPPKPHQTKPNQNKNPWRIRMWILEETWCL